MGLKLMNSQTDTSRLSPAERSKRAIAAAQERARLKKLSEPAPVKVEIKPTASPAASAVKPLPVQTVKSTVAAGNTPESPAAIAVEPLPASVELWISLEARIDREVPGWTYLPKERSYAIVTIVNIQHWMAKWAFENSEPRALPWLFGHLLSEFLVTHQRKNPWVAAVMDHLRRRLFREEEDGSFSRSWLSERLASTKVFAGLREVIAESSDGKRQKIFTLMLD
jgi:hypothetical protein